MFDAHAHLQDSRFTGLLPGVLKAALDAQVTGICCCGTAPSDWRAVTDVSSQSSSAELVIIPSFGVHPWYVEDLPDDWMSRLEELIDSNPVAAVGEIGLDGLHKEIPRELQVEVLKVQLDLAAAYSCPVVLHGARAWGDLVAVLKPCADRIPSIIAHGFSGSVDIMNRFVEMGAYLSFAGSVCNPRSKKVREAAALTPDGQLLIETDSPDIFPDGGMPAAMDHKNRPVNQPCNLKQVCESVAELRHVSPDVIADITASNARCAFLD